MKTFLFFDTETTGLAKMNLPHYDESQPRVVQLAAILSDEAGRELMSLNSYVVPNGFTIPEEVVKIHGTDTAKATELGLVSTDVINMFAMMAGIANVYVCHNIAFDLLVVKHEFYKHGIKLPLRDEVCTMLQMTNKCRIPHPKYPNRTKWPKLQEAYKWCFNREFDKAHDALADIRACKEIFFHALYDGGVTRRMAEQTDPYLQTR